MSSTATPSTAAVNSAGSGSEPWFRNAVGYQVYVRSFADTTGNGIGDVWGVVDHVDHIASLGVDFVWLNPVYPSPGLDHGYDVADYTTIAHDMGGMDAFTALRDALHDHGIRLLMDIVPGHTSDQHAWFRDALTGPDAQHRDFYVWRDPADDGGPPNNWPSVFGGPAWTLDEPSGQYYMHRFLPEQPDLNWRNPAVRTAMEDILRHWFDHGLDGFRIDVAHGMLADPTFADVVAPTGATSDPHARDAQLAGFMGRPETPDLYRSWRAIADDHDAVLVGEVGLAVPASLTPYVSDGRLHRALFLSLQHTTWDPHQLRAVISAGLDAAGGRLAWPQSSHDDWRAASRFGGGARGRRRSLAFTFLVACLPGNPVLLAGDELALENGALDPGHGQDPVSSRGDALVASRDGSRTPMPWDDSTNCGFTTGTPWLPLGANRTTADTVAAQDRDPSSALGRVRRLLAARRGLTDMLADHEVRWLDTDPEVIAWCRGDVVVACNTGDATTVDLPGPGSVVVASDDDARTDGTVLRLGRDTCAITQVHDGLDGGRHGRDG